MKILCKLGIIIPAAMTIANLSAQTDMHTLISASNGVSKHFVRLPEDHQVAFDPATANEFFGLGKESKLILKNKVVDQLGFIHYRYFQNYKGNMIENSMFIVHTKNGLIQSVNGSIVTSFSKEKASEKKNLTKDISAAEAITIALKFVHAKVYAWEDSSLQYAIRLQRNDPSATYYPVPEKVWFTGDTISSRNLRLCYKVDVYSTVPADRKYIFVDAQTGRINGIRQIIATGDVTGNATTAFSGTQIIHADQDGSRFRLRDYTKGDGIFTLHADGDHDDYTSSSSNWSLSGADQFALDAHYGVSATWAFYKDNFSRNSIDDKGYRLISFVNDPGWVDNAVWDGDQMRFGNIASITGLGIVAIDITGHELTHGVTGSTSELIYEKEPGAINESISDIMGKSVQFYTKPNDINWQIGNDIGLAKRDMGAPKTQLQPSTYKQPPWFDVTSCNTPVRRNDYCGVHKNSSIGNLMFFLLVNGGSGTNDLSNAFSVNGIGLFKADQIIYRTETVYLTPTSQYADWWAACLYAASDLFGPASDELQQVENAWYAVGFGNAAPLTNEYNRFTYFIKRPIVNKTPTIYDGTDGRPSIRFSPGDSVIITAGGCVQTGGVRLTWKRYVNPSGPNSDRFYFCLIQVPGLTAGLVPLKTLAGSFDPQSPDQFTIDFKTNKVPASITGGQRFLVLGYTDDDFHDNNYDNHDNGTEDQCMNCGDAFMTVTIFRKKVTIQTRPHGND